MAAALVCGALGVLLGADILYIIAYLILGYDILAHAAKSIARLSFDENVLMSIATLCALALGEYFEAAAVMLLYQAGEMLCGAAEGRSEKALESLLDIKPEYARLIRDGKIVDVSPEELKIGDIIAVSPGEMIPADGVVTEGTSQIDTSSMTGEAALRSAAPGVSVMSGTLNGGGLIKVRVTAEYKDSAVSKVAALLEKAKTRKSSSEKFLTVFAKRYTPIVLILALLTALLPPLITGGDFSAWLYRALVLLVVSCPCALVISIPLAMFTGMGAAAKNGILIKGSASVERLSKIKTVCFDKTGTLTKGAFEVTAIRCNGIKAELLEKAAHAEFYSTHPMAAAVVEAYTGVIDPERISDYTEIPGKGIEAVIDGDNVLLGSTALLAERSIDPVRTHDGSAIYAAINGKYAGYFEICDTVKDNSATAVQRLQGKGIRTYILSGDSRAAVNRAAMLLGVGEAYSELLPDQKAELLERFKKDGTTAFVGDGMNDAPVLAAADVGISMGIAGSETAVEVSDVVIMNDSPEAVADAVSLSRRIMRLVWENIIFSVGIKLAAILLGIFADIPLFIAVFADVGVCMLAILNSMRGLNSSKQQRKTA